MLWKYISCGNLRRVPGPRAVPIFGNILQIDKARMRLSLHRWAKIYGGVYKLKLPIGDTVVVSDYHYIHKVLVENGKDFAGRISFFRFDFLELTQNLFYQQDSDTWRRLRKVTHRYMNQFGSGKSSLEEILLQNADYLLEVFSSSCGTPIDTMDTVRRTAMRSIAALLLGQNLQPEDPFLDMLLKYENDIKHMTEMTPGTLILDAFPWLIHAPLQASVDLKNLNKLQAGLWSKIKDLQASCETDSVTSVFLDFIKDERDIEGKSECTISETVVKMSCLSLILAGVATTSRAMYCLLNTIAFRRDIQDKICAEVSNVLSSSVGNSKVTFAQRERMPYFMATILECLRVFTPTPSGGVAHSPVDNNQELPGYGIIPKGVIMLLNYWALHHEASFWSDPDAFRPERFLDEDGQLVPPDHPNRKHLLPFGAGPRGCVGEVFAKTRLFMWTAHVVSTFELSPGPDSDEIWMNPNVHPESNILEPLPTRIVFAARD